LLTVVVLAVAADKSLVTAIRSLLMQDTPCDIIDVNSNGGNAAAVLGNLGGKVKLIEVEKLLYAGGARNLGLRAATTPFVAFLAFPKAAPYSMAFRFPGKRSTDMASLMKACGRAKLPTS
jgi:protein-L-isoaspartate O-methyltransferase